MTEQLIYIAVMAVLTYLIRVPYAVLAALTFPAIFTATGNVVTSTAGTLVALVLAYFDMGLVIVAVGAVAGALLAGIFL